MFVPHTIHIIWFPLVLLFVVVVIVHSKHLCCAVYCSLFVVLNPCVLLCVVVCFVVGDILMIHQILKRHRKVLYIVPYVSIVIEKVAYYKKVMIVSYQDIVFLLFFFQYNY